MAKQQIIITKVDKSRWSKAQKSEFHFAEDTHDTGDDWNGWWKKEFDNYKVLKGKSYKNVLETGCGPHTNLRLILPIIRAENLYLEDPLMRGYFSLESELEKAGKESKLLGRIKQNKEKTTNHLHDIFKNEKYKVDLSASALEILPYKDAMMDLVICINVLDHVEDVEKCMNEMYRVLKEGGVLVMGQDLSNEEDFRLCPESWEDTCHPIKVDEATMDSYVKGYKRLFYKRLSRKAGRNPAAHYGTYLLIAQKK